MRARRVRRKRRCGTLRWRLYMCVCVFGENVHMHAHEPYCWWCCAATKVELYESAHALECDHLAGLMRQLNAPDLHLGPLVAPIRCTHMSVAVVAWAGGHELKNAPLGLLTLHLPQPIALGHTGPAPVPAHVHGGVCVTVQEQAARFSDALQVV